MTLTMQLGLLPTNAQKETLEQTTHCFINTINEILDCAIAVDDMPVLSSRDMRGVQLPSALKAQAAREAMSIWKKTNKRIIEVGKENYRLEQWYKEKFANGEDVKEPEYQTVKYPVLKKPAAIWNNQNYGFKENKYLSVPVLIDGKTKRIDVEINFSNDCDPEKIFNFLNSVKLGTLRVTKKDKKYVAQIAYSFTTPLEDKDYVPEDGPVMGVDLGIKCPAVSVDSNGNSKFYGNGRQRRYMRRKYYAKRKSMSKAKKMKAVKKLNNKEQRWMTDSDHKLSRQIVNEAIRAGVKVIRMENLTGIRKGTTQKSATRTSRKNNRSINSWPFYRLQAFITYKAEMAGIRVELVDPAYTSQTCPICGERHKAKDRTYCCPACGYKGHRDLVGAINIRDAQPGIAGQRTSR